jgi:hypothetical protein
MHPETKKSDHDRYAHPNTKNSTTTLVPEPSALSGEVE